MPLYNYHHATIFVPPDIASPLEVYRQAWDPVMAEQIAAHVTLIYPQEVSGAELLTEKLRNICSATTSFRLKLGNLTYSGSPEGGVYVAVDDTEGACGRLRTQVLRSPAEIPLHVTLVHPRTSSRGRELWDQANLQLPQSEFRVKEVAITGFDGAKWATLHRFELKAI